MTAPGDLLDQAKASGCYAADTCVWDDACPFVSTCTQHAQLRLKVGALPAHTPSGWGWWYEVHDMSRPVGQLIRSSGLRYTWAEAMRDGAAALRHVKGKP